MKVNKIYVLEESGEYRLASPLETLKAANEILPRLFKRGQQFTSAKESISFISIKLAAREQEVFACLFLDNRHRLIEYEELFFGTIDSSAVYPRQVVKRALHHNAAAVIAAHNHPSGVAEPSRADETITLRLKEALALIDVRLLDHVIIGDSCQVSLAERGIL